MMRPGQAAEHDFDHGEADKGCDGPGVALEIAGETAIAADRGKRPFVDPAFRQDDKFMGVVAFDDFDAPGPDPGDRFGCTRPLISAIGKDALDEWEQTARLEKDRTHAVAILNIGRVDENAQQKTKRVDEDMPLAARNFLARIKALRVDRRPPF